MIRAAIVAASTALAISPAATALAASPYDAMIAQHAAANGVPVELVHRVIIRESRYRPHVVSKGNYGMMQIKLATARGLGYTGTAQGLLDANTNLTYAVRYLAGAYRAAKGNHNLAVRYYAGGYYYAAKAQGWNSNAQRVGDGGSLIPAAFTSAAHAPAARPEIVSDAAHRKTDGNPFLFTLKQEQPPGAQARRGAETNPFVSMFQPAPQKHRRGRGSRG
jgi:soluble lytic murein transglycosylase-like protein